VLKTGIEYEYADRAKDTGFSLNTFSLNGFFDYDDDYDKDNDKDRGTGFNLST